MTISSRTPGGRISSSLHPFMFAAFPIVTVVAANAAIYPIQMSVLARALAIAWGATALLLWILRYPGWSLAARAAWLSTFLIALNLYFLVPVPPGFDRRVGSGTGSYAVLYILACGALASVVIRPWRDRPRDPMPLTIVAAVLLGMNAFPVARAVLTRDDRSRVPVDDLATPSFPERDDTRPERDVYVIVLDAFGRPDVLRESYGLDMGALVSSLEANGFYVPARSRSNYAQTFLALASMLNMGYLDDVAAAAGRDSRDRRPLKDLIERNALMALARRAQYTVVGVASDYTATETFPAADVCFCALPWPHELEISALRLSPFVDLGRERWMAAGRRRRVLDAFQAIEGVRRLPGRKFVVAHLISPHPPFVFDREGQARVPPEDAPFIDGEWLPAPVRAAPGFEEEYVRGYSEQVEFISRRLLRMIDLLLEEPGPRPAIMIVGDHGPGLRLDLQNPDRTDMRERMSILSAYYLPGQDAPALYPGISPVNGARAVASRYLGVDAPYLTERSAFSTWLRPYTLVPVAADAF